MERRGEFGSVILYSDYAHHPTEIEAVHADWTNPRPTLEAASSGLLQGTLDLLVLRISEKDVGRVVLVVRIDAGHARARLHVAGDGAQVELGRTAPGPRA